MAHRDCEKLMPLIHLPVQSGSDKIFKSMNRKHTIKEYLSILDKLKKINPNIKFSSDFIIGYPGENFKDYQKTINLMKEIKFINSYSFVYSARPGTPAYNLDTIDQIETKKRLVEFQTIAEKIKTDYRKDLIGKNFNVLFENKINNENKYFGRDEFYNSVIVESDNDLIGKIINIKVLKINQNTLFGEKILNLNNTSNAA